MDVPEIDPNFEPQQRARSNTWPLRPKVELPEDPHTPTGEEARDGEGGALSAGKDPLGLGKAKTSSRRNAWGNLSYADLITKAIQSSPEQRLTLSQIYDWMVQNVPYFKDKGDSNSSAGWKVSTNFLLLLALDMYMYHKMKVCLCSYDIDTYYVCSIYHPVHTKRDDSAKVECV